MVGQNPTPAISEHALDEIIAAYLDAVDSGQTPERTKWLERFPEAAAALTVFFDDQDRLQRRVAPLRACLGEPQAAADTGPLLGTRIGKYELIEEIARGGMGIVFKARQIPLNRLVALKMILTGELASQAEQERFQREAEATAKLDHPNIVPIYEIDTWQNQPYFSMRLIEGGSLAQWLASSQAMPGFLDSARLLATVAQAVHFAHERGILHRDLKPANVLLQVDQGKGADLHFAVPLVSDFGLAKWLEGGGSGGGTLIRLPDATEKPQQAEGKEADQGSAGLPGPFFPTTRLTQTGMALGTPSYMAPEQVGAAIQTPSHALTSAADVYSLGAILYEIMTGLPPFRAATGLDTMRLVLEQPPTPPRQHNPAVPSDLEAICLKCLEKNPLCRYESAQALADDLDRFVRGEPIQGRPVVKRRPPAWAKWAFAAMGFCSLAAVILVMVFSKPGPEAQSKKVPPEPFKNHSGPNPKPLALEQSPLDLLKPDKIAVEDRLEKVPELTAVLKGPPQMLLGLAFTPDGKKLAGAGLDGTVFIWDLTGAAPGPATSLGGTGGDLAGVAISPDGKRIACANRFRARIYDLTRPGYPQLYPDVELSLAANPGVAFSPSGKILAMTDNKGVHFLDLAGPVPVLSTGPMSHAGHVKSVAFDRDGKWLLTAGSDGSARLWDRSKDPATEKAVLYSTRTNYTFCQATFSPDGKTIAAGCMKGMVYVWDVNEGNPKLRWPPKPGHRQWAVSVAFASDGKSLVSAEAGNLAGPTQVVWWNAANGKIIKSWEFPERCTMAAFAPSGLYLALTSYQSKVYILRLTPPAN